MNKWADKFQKKLQEQERAKLEIRKSYSDYRNAVLSLFEQIERKIKEIKVIEIQRKITAQTTQGVSGPKETIRALILRYDGKRLEFEPEGVNLDSSRGRIRIRHNTSLSQFIYLHLIMDPQAEETSPENLIWVFNERGDDEEFDSLPKFEEKMLEKVIEDCFLDS